MEMELPVEYYSDEYPREGCRLEIDVRNGCYWMSVYPPGREKAIERYAGVETPDGIGRMVREWCAGKAPVLRRKSDYSVSAGSQVTS